MLKAYINRHLQNYWKKHEKSIRGNLILRISSKDRDTATSVIEELEFQFVDSKKFKIVDRKTLDTIGTEQNFQLSGDVDDNSAVSIGKMLGANIVITGTISGTGSAQRLTIKALDVKTAQIITMAREQF
jgi:TolB-like protein